MIRVCIADDHPVVRDGLAATMNAQHDIEVVDVCEDGRDVLRKAHDADWNVLLLDIRMPNTDGIEVVSQLKSLRPDIRIVVFSMYPEEQYGPRLLKAGASAYLTKGRSTEEILTAVRRASQGRKYVTQTIAERLLDEPDAGDESGRLIGTLTNRELQILRIIAEGASTNEVAERICVSPSTVSTHIANIKRKLNAKTFGELVVIAIRAGLEG